MRKSILRQPNAVRSKNVAAKRCTIVHKARYVFLLDVVRVNHFQVHNLKKSRDILTDPMKRRNFGVFFHVVRKREFGINHVNDFKLRHNFFFLYALNAKTTSCHCFFFKYMYRASFVFGLFIMQYGN